MERYSTRRINRRAFLKLGVAGAAIVGGAAAIRQNWPSSRPVAISGSPGPEDTPGIGGVSAPGPNVAIVRGEDPAAMVRSAVALAGGLQQIVHPGAIVLIKPNLTIPSPSGLGNVTDSRVLQVTIELCQEAGANQILVGDGSGGGDTEEIMQQAGYEPIIEASGATFVDFNRDEVVTRRLDDPFGLAEYSLTKTPVEAPILISLPVLKLHDEAIVTLSCKNLVGIAARQVYGQPRQQLHDAGVQKVIADIVRLRTPDFAIIDGIVGLEGDSPMNGRSVPMGLIVAGRNPVSVDAVGAAIMGVDPQSLEQLTLLVARNVGEMDLAKIVVKGSAIADVQRPFLR